VDEKMKWPVIVGSNGVKKMIPASQITQHTFSCPQKVGHLVPAPYIEAGCFHGGPNEAHSASTIRNCELPPVALVG
jgi:hypothetical protein